LFFALTEELARGPAIRGWRTEGGLIELLGGLEGWKRSERGRLNKRVEKDTSQKLNFVNNSQKGVTTERR